MPKLTSKKVFLVLRIFCDLLLIPFIFILAYSLKFKIGWTMQNIFSLPFGKIYQHAQIEPYLDFLGLIIILWLISFYFSGMYKKFSGLMPQIDELLAIFKGVSISTIEIMAITLIFPTFPASRYVIFYAWLLSLLIFSLERYFLKKLEIKFLTNYSKEFTNTLIIGANELGQDIAEKIILDPTHKLKYLGFLDHAAPKKIHFHLKNKFKLLGTYNDYAQIISTKKIKTIFLATQIKDTTYLENLILYCTENQINLKILSNISSIMNISLEVEEFDGLPFICHQIKEISIAQQFSKRTFDFLGSLLLLLLFSPLFLIIALLIKISTPNAPVFYHQQRMTKNNQIFKMVKFRTMHLHAEADTGPILAPNNDPRLIKYGHFLRTTGLDELPQLYNILLGQMSFVGPRPERPFFIKKFQNENPYYNLRHLVKGGLTGLAQINGRTFLSNQPAHKIKYDIYYIKNWSFLLDLKIILKTFPVILKKEAFY
jgi:exopolysaccharide biosynthesis polyprenyl glycosylphosphotransferase